MRKSVKAALLSGLVLPGIGHFYLKRFITGALLLLATLASLYLIITVVVERAMEIAARIVKGEVSPDVAVISEMILRIELAFAPLPADKVLISCPNRPVKTVKSSFGGRRST
ncbi:MAG: hypothetical protein R6W72_07445, partial [Desulfurivibrionaceae bacterium]